jgi:hypothetical protein
MAAVVGLIDDLKAAKAAGRKDADLTAALYLQRRSQFYLDFVEAENSTGFHAPQEAARILGESIDLARQGQIALRDPAFKPTVPVINIPPLPRRRSPERPWPEVHDEWNTRSAQHADARMAAAAQTEHSLSVLALVALGVVVGAAAIIGRK